MSEMKFSYIKRKMDVQKLTLNLKMRPFGLHRHNYVSCIRQVKHIKHIFEEEELDEESVVRKFRTTAADGKSYNTIHYNLDMIISLGYRVKSKIATNFRRWATERLKEYMIKGFTMDDERLKNLGGGNYWKELLERIRDIHSSEKVMYRQVLDLYATSVDYDPKSSESIAFFKMVQNHRQLKKQQKNIGNIRYRTYRRLKKNT